MTSKSRKLLSLGVTSVLFSIFAVSANAQNLEWATQAGGLSNESGRGIAVDDDGNSYVTGFFFGTAHFGAGGTAASLISLGNSDIFIAKYDDNGDLLWAKQAGGLMGEAGLGIAVDDDGKSYVTGAFTGTATFGASEFNETTLVSNAWNDIFIAKYDSSGNLEWAKQAGNPTATFANDEGLGIAVDGSNNSYVTGYFNGTATFGEADAAIVLTGAGEDDIFIAKYDGDGNLVWAEQAGGDSSDEGLGIAVDGLGNSYVTGQFQGSATFGEEITEVTLDTGSSFDRNIFIAKYDGSGDLVWAEQAGGDSSDEGLGIAVDGLGNSYVTGQFQGSATFGTTELTGAINGGMFIAKFDSSGIAVWAEQAGGMTGSATGVGIAANDAGDSYVGGNLAAQPPSAAPS